MSKLLKKPENESIEILTVYTPHEANYYLLDDYLKDPTKAKVIKCLKYDKPPVIRMKPTPKKGKS
jgi:hypothetical protein